MESSALVYILLTVITVWIACYIQNKDYVAGYIRGGYTAGQYGGYHRQQARNTVAEIAIYCLLAGVSACRIAVGNDYWVYRDNFKLIAQERHVASEFGFNTIVYWMQDLFGYDKYLPIFGLFSLVTVFFLVKALHAQASYYALSLFLLMTGGYYFNSLNSVRYYLALAIALFSMKYVLRGEYGKFVLWILFGAMFHKSIVLVIPVYLLARFLAFVKLRTWHYVVGGIFLLSLVFGQDLYREIVFYFYPYYENSTFDNGQLSYVNIGKCLCVLMFSAICYRRSMKQRNEANKDIQIAAVNGAEIACEGMGKETTERDLFVLSNRFYFFLNLAGLVVYCCGSFIPEVSRIGYYMIISQVFLLPNLLADMKNGWFKKLCYVGVIGAFGFYFVMLLKGMYAVDVRLLPYLNWIFN